MCRSRSAHEGVGRERRGGGRGGGKVEVGDAGGEGISTQCLQLFFFSGTFISSSSSSLESKQKRQSNMNESMITT